MFIRNKSLKLGDKIILIQNVSVMAGTFEKGTEMTCINLGERGADFVDEEGNKLLETGLSGNSFYKLIN